MNHPVVGWIGLGKLGLTCALALAHRGDVGVVGYDVTDTPERIRNGELAPPKERGLNGLLIEEREDPRLRIVDTVREVVADTTEIVFVSAQTPHSPEYGGEAPPPSETKDFEYGFVTNAVRAVAAEAARQRKHVTIVVISTVLPGTSRKYLLPALNEFTSYVYNPYFIAMGTTVDDFLRPEFVLIGTEDETAAADLISLYLRVHDRPMRVMSVESAELTKVAYNTFISMKIVFANTLMEICHKTGADVDEVASALQQANQRITSGAYMRGGMGDGGGCHPRDNIAMAHLAERLDLHADPFTFVTETRTSQSQWIADEVLSWSELTSMPVVILGFAFKPESNLILGSPALLLAHQLLAAGLEPMLYDPWVDSEVDGYDRIEGIPSNPCVFVLGAKHESNLGLDLPKGSVVIDPFGYFPDRQGLTVVRLGRKK